MRQFGLLRSSRLGCVLAVVCKYFGYIRLRLCCCVPRRLLLSSCRRLPTVIPKLPAEGLQSSPQPQRQDCGTVPRVCCRVTNCPDTGFASLDAAHLTKRGRLRGNGNSSTRKNRQGAPGANLVRGSGQDGVAREWYLAGLGIRVQGWGTWRAATCVVAVAGLHTHSHPRLPSKAARAGSAGDRKHHKRVPELACWSACWRRAAPPCTSTSPSAHALI